MNRSAPLPTSRLVSVDALRGFDMLWICGAGTLVGEIATATGSPFWNMLAGQMDHAGWTGFRFFDLIFPLFLFLSGVTIPFSSGRRVEQGAGRGALLGHAVLRWAALVLLGVVYNGGLELRPLAETRVFSVLGLIGTGWFIAAVVHLHAKPRARVFWAAGILVAYWLVLRFFPVPGHGPGVHTPEAGVTGWVDRFMPWRLYQTHFDPEGLLPCLASGFVAITGCLAGEFLRGSARPPVAKCGMLALTGAVLLGLGWVVALSMPVSKPQWNPPFMLTCCGCSLLALALFHLLVDVTGWRAAARPLVVIGMNPIVIYLLLRIVPMDTVSTFFFGGVAGLLPDAWRPAAGTLGFMLTWWLLLWFLYRRKWFARV